MKARTGDKVVPIHCPFDRIVIKKLKGVKNINWTKMNDINEYKRLIIAVKQEASSQKIAEWELKIHNDLMHKGKVQSL